MMTIEKAMKEKLLVDEYGALKEEEKELNNKIKELNDAIKTYMGHNNLDTLEGSGFVASYTLRVKKEFEQEKLITSENIISVLKDRLSEDVISDIIKTTEYIDTDALESAIYHGEVDKDTLKEIGKYKKITRTPTLNVNARK